MKKLLTGLLALLMLVSSVFVLSSCAKKPELDLEDAKEALEDAEYVVNYVEESDKNGVESYLSASKKVDGDDLWDTYDIKITKYEKASTAKLEYQIQKKQYEMTLEYYKLEIKKAKHYLSKYEKDLSSSEIDSYEGEIKELEKALEEYKEDYVIGRSGKYVWYGDLKALEATK